MKELQTELGENKVEMVCCAPDTGAQACVNVDEQNLTKCSSVYAYPHVNIEDTEGRLTDYKGKIDDKDELKKALGI